MRPWHSRRIAEAIVGLIALAACAARAGSERLVLDIVLDGRPGTLVGEFERVDGRLFGDRAILERIGVVVPASDLQWIALDSLPGVRTQLIESRQQVLIDRPLDARPTTEVGYPVGERADAQRLAPGAGLDYDVALDRIGGEWQRALRLTPRAFGPAGVVIADGAWFDGVVHGWRRYDAYAERDLPERVERIRIGDAIDSVPSWGRPVRFAGLHWGTDFSVRPDLVTFPLPGYEGTAAVPSTLDVFVDGLRRQSSDVPAGPFSIPQLPLVTGGGEALIVLRDPLGREQVHALPFYASSTRLRAGLSDYGFDVGRLREGFGSAHDHYTDTFASATFRRGLDDRYTLEAHAEASADVRVFGAGIAGAIGDLGEWAIAAARSDGTACDGSFASAETRVQRGRFSVRALVQAASRTWCDLASLHGAAQARRSAQLSFGFDAPVGQVNASLISRAFEDTRQRIGTLGWSVPIARRASLTLGVLFDRSTDARDDVIAQCNLVVAFGGARASSLALGGTSGSNGSAFARYDVPVPIGVGRGGYAQTYLDRNDVSAGYFERTRVLQWSVEAASQSDATSMRSEAQGALTWIDGSLFASRQLGDAFAIVDTDGIAGVGVARENQPVGRTGASGRLLVEQLVPFVTNHLSIDPKSLPPDAALDQSAFDVRPYRGGGVVSAPRVRRSLQHAWRVRDAQGKDLPVGSVLWIDGHPLQTVGYDGGLYLAAPAPGVVGEVRGGFGACRIDAWPPAVEATTVLTCRSSR